jgi:hypothetical protein
MMVNTLIVGGGPAGVAPLISASRSGSLERILADGVALVERGSRIGAGRVGGYAVKSDSTGSTLVSCVQGNPHPALGALQIHPVVEAVAAYGASAVPLTLVAKFMEVVGSALCDRLTATGNTILFGHEALNTTQTGNGLWRTKLRCLSDGGERLVLSSHVVLATGGHQPLSALARRYVGGRALLSGYQEKLIQSDEALTAAGLDAIGRRFVAGRSKRIAIIGSSSSALACANAVLQTSYGQAFGENALALLHRRPLRIFYPAADAALGDGYAEFGKDDICPISGFVFRLSGLRLEARELVMAARGLGGRAPEKRLRLHQVGAEDDPVALRILDEADVIVSALGYRARALPVMTASGHSLPLFADEADANPLVDGECRVLDRHGTVVPGLLAIGLGTGFFSREIVGGELSFSGQTNSLWQWQNAVGGLIARAIQRREPAQAARLVPSGVLSALSPLRSA